MLELLALPLLCLFTLLVLSYDVPKRVVEPAEREGTVHQVTRRQKHSA
ncbi:MAG: hypothetical protein ACKVVP_23700 [Chloroflexota bacterium]